MCEGVGAGQRDGGACLSLLQSVHRDAQTHEEGNLGGIIIVIVDVDVDVDASHSCLCRFCRCCVHSEGGGGMASPGCSAAGNIDAVDGDEADVDADTDSRNLFRQSSCCIIIANIQWQRVSSHC